MGSVPVQLGVGGIFVLLLLQMLLPWLSKVAKPTNGANGKAVALKSGDMDPAYWHKAFHDITEEIVQKSMIQLLKPSLDAQNETLRDIKESNQAIRDGVRQLVLAQESDERRRAH